MNKTIITFLLSTLYVCAFSQSVQDRAYSAKLQKLLSHSVPEISVSEVDTTEDILFIDSREKSEYEVSHIKNAVFVGYNKLDLSALANTPKNQKIIVYCSVGYRSEKVSEKLIKNGFTDVSNLYGGIFEWKNAGLQVYTKNSQPTDRVHAYDKNWGQWLKQGTKCYK